MDNSETRECPNCSEQVDVYDSRKQISSINYECIHCGLHIYPVTEYFDLEELNHRRKDQYLKPLAELPEQRFHT